MLRHYGTHDQNGDLGEVTEGLLGQRARHNELGRQGPRVDCRGSLMEIGNKFR